MKRWIFMGLAVGVLALSAQAWAEGIGSAGTSNMDDVFVTATRTEQQLEKIGGSSVTVITAKDIEAKKQTTVSEVLKGIPGVDIARTGGPGAETTVFLRGADSKNTLILIDGMMFNDPSTPNRNADIANLITDNIERIEVVRGPMSVLYGSNATAGVINIITKKGKAKPSVQAGMEGGSYDTWKYSGGVQGALDRFNFSLLGATIQTDGFSVADDDNPDIPHAGNTGEKDGWKNNSLYGKFGLDITPDFDISANFIYYDSKVDTDDWGNGYAGDRFDYDPETWMFTPSPNGRKDGKSEKDNTTGRISVHNYLFNREFESTLDFHASRSKSSILDNDAFKLSDFKGNAKECSWQGGFNFLKYNVLDLGLNYMLETMDSNSYAISDKEAYTKSIWIQDQILLGDNFVFVAGLRNDDHENFGNKATYRLSPSYSINGTTVKASYGTGFRAPSLYELYSAYGNKDLDAEESYGWDVGIEQTVDVFKFGLTYFSLSFDNRIGWDWDIIIPGMPYPGGYNQLDGKSKTNGVETFIQYHPLSSLDFTLNYTYTDSEDPNGVHLERRPYHKIQLNTRYQFSKKGQFNMDVFRVGERDAIKYAMDKNENQVKNLDAYTLVNVSAQYDVTDYLNVYARVDNLFDEFYEEAWSYATPGMSGYVGMKIKY
jgi:vitamin B12 transporter